MADLLSFWPFLFGWPAVALSVLAASFGLGRGHPRLLLVAATLVGPMSAHLALTPRFFVSGFVWGLFPVGVYLAAAVATRRNHLVLGAALVAANTAFFGWLAVGSSVKPVSGVTAVGQASSNSEPIRSGRPCVHRGHRPVLAVDNASVRLARPHVHTGTTERLQRPDIQTVSVRSSRYPALRHSDKHRPTASRSGPGAPACTGDIDRCWPSTTPASGWPGRMSIPGRPVTPMLPMPTDHRAFKPRPSRGSPTIVILEPSTPTAWCRRAGRCPEPAAYAASKWYMTSLKRSRAKVKRNTSGSAPTQYRACSAEGGMKTAVPGPISVRVSSISTTPRPLST